MNIVQKIEQAHVKKLMENKEIPDFSAGDTVRVDVRIVEGKNERLQAFEGVCIARKNAGINSAFTVRKIASGEGVERIFPLYGPRVEKITVIRQGAVRRAKLYYLRGLTGKKARIKEKSTFVKKEDKAAAKKPAAKKKEAAPAPASE